MADQTQATPQPTPPAPDQAPVLLDAPPDMPAVQGTGSLADLFAEVTDPYVNPMRDITDVLNQLPAAPQAQAQPPAAQPDKSAPAPVAPPPDWESRYKNLQSYYDEQRVHWDKVSQALGSADPNEVAQARAIRDAIVSDPELFGLVTSKLGQPGAPLQPPAPAAPPPRPANFEPDDVFVPGTPSYNWTQQMEEYRQQKIVSDIARAVDARLSAIERKQQEAQTRRQLEEARQTLRQRASSTLTDPRQVDEFMQFVDRGPAALGLPQTPDPEYLVAMYLAIRQTMDRRGGNGAITPNPNAAQPQDVVAARLAALKSQTVPPTTSVTQVPGETQELSPGDDFLAGIKAASAKRFSLL
jgi:hypothetical protein